MGCDLLFTLFQSPEPSNWWTSLFVGETVGLDWLLFVLGCLFAAIGGYMTYATMLYNVIASNRHPANFRRIVLTFVLLFIILWFIFIFRNAFGGMVAGLLLAIWLALAVIFFLSKRSVTSS